MFNYMLTYKVITSKEKKQNTHKQNAKTMQFISFE
jgi:hypothetical protein